MMKWIGVFTLVIFLFVVFAFLMVDIFINGRVWLSRIKIGRCQDAAKWNKKIRFIAEKWIFHTPVIKKTDQSRLILKDILCGDYKNGTIQSWQLGGLYLGLTEHTCNEEVLDGYEARFLSQDGRWLEVPKEVDGALLAYAILRRTKNPTRVRPAMDQVYQIILDRVENTDGCVCYRKGMPEVRFVDTIGFVCPFLVCYGQKYHVPEAARLACLQIKTYAEKGLFSGGILPVHAYQAVSGLPMGAYGWGRGTGWFMLGLIDVCLEIDDNHKEKDGMLDLLKKTADGILDFQGSNGGFSANLCIGDRQDSSITAIAAYFYRSCFRIWGEKRYQNAADRCIKALMEVTRRSGAIDFSQGDTKGIGNYARTFDIMPFTQGMACRQGRTEC